MMSVIRGIESRFQAIVSLTITFILTVVSLLPAAVAAVHESDNQSASSGSVAAAALVLDEAVAVALENSPELASLQANFSAASTLPSQVQSLPDPVLALNLMNMPVDNFNFGQEAMTQVQVALSQSIPFPGKRRLQKESAEHEAKAAAAMLAERRGAIAGQVRSAWWRLMQFERALEIIAQNKDLMRDFVDIAQTKYRVGNGLQQDVLLAQLELSRLLNREMGLQGMRSTTQAELNALLNRSTDRLVTLPAVPKNRELPELPPQRVLLQQAGSAREMIAVQRNLVEVARTRLDLEKRNRYPDFKLGVGYGFRQGDDPLRNRDRSDLLTVMLSFSVPLFSGTKQNKAVEQRSYEVSRQTFALSDTLRQVEASVSGYFAQYQAARDQVMLFETAIIPQAQQTVSSMLAGYQVNQVDFLNLINSQITLYNAQISYWDSLSNAKQMLAKLTAATGLETLYE